MKVKTRFTFLLGLLLLGFAAALLGLQWLEQREQRHAAADVQRSREQQLDHWLSATNASLRHYAGEGARAIREGIAITSDDPADSGAVAFWVVRSDGTLARANTEPGIAALPIPADQIARWNQTPPPTLFCCDTETGLLEICVQPIPSATDGAPTGWVLAARRWDDARLRVLSSLTEGHATLASHPAKTDPNDSFSVVVRPLLDWQGRPLRWLQIIHPSPAGVRWFEIRAPQTRLFFAFGLLLMVAFGLSLHRWVLRPLQHISASLSRGDSTPIAQLRTANDELGGVARLVDQSFTQRDLLRAEIAERERTEAALVASEDHLRRTLAERTQLGRDLHDGVIQSLYATGMGLAGVRNLLAPDQAEAAARLEQSRAALNETILDVRNFITGLEPEGLRQQTFTHAVSSLLELMQSIRPAQLSCDIDEAIAARLTLTQRANILHITREAVSNALRHGAADRVNISLRGTPEGGAVFVIDDDGRGFSSVSGESDGSSGHGLENFTIRAREIDAGFTIRSLPGRGTKLSFIFDPPHLT